MRLIKSLLFNAVLLSLIFSGCFAYASTAKNTENAPALFQMLAFARKLVIESDLKFLAEQENLKSLTAEFQESWIGDDNTGPWFSLDVPLLSAQLHTMQFDDGWSDIQGLDGSKSNNSASADAKRLARLAHDGSACIPTICNFYLYTGNLTGMKDPAVIQKWDILLQIGGSGKFFQGNLVLSPRGLISHDDAEYITALLKKTGSYVSAELTEQQKEKTNEFVAAINSFENSNERVLSAITEIIVFESTRQWSVGAKIIVSEELPGQYSLFLIMGTDDFRNDLVTKME